jgi:hypothetical protein
MAIRTKDLEMRLVQVEAKYQTDTLHLKEKVEFEQVKRQEA